MDQIKKNSTPAPIIKNPAKAIRAFCLDCVNDSPNEVKLCPEVGCPLYPWRFGKKPPELRKERTDAQKEASRKNFEAMRRARNLQE